MSTTFELNRKYSKIEDIIEAYGEDQLKLDLGCGYYKPAGYVGIDNGIGFPAQIANEDNLPDIVMDIDKGPLPFEDDSCTEVRASHFLEHSNDGVHVINEIYRVIKPDGLFRLILPYANSALGMYPGHNVYFTEKWFQENIWFQEHWEIREEIYIESDYWKKAPRLIRLVFPFNWARIFLFNACDQMELRCYPKNKA